MRYTSDYDTQVNTPTYDSSDHTSHENERKMALFNGSDGFMLLRFIERWFVKLGG